MYIQNDNLSTNIFDDARKNINKNLVQKILPGGKWKGSEYWVKNPLRDDKSEGSFSISSSGLYNDFSSGDKGDIIGLYAAMKRIKSRQAAEEILKLSGGYVQDSNPVAKAKKEPWQNTDKLPTFSNKPSLITPYDTEDGRRAFVVVRWESPKGKIIVPYYFTESGQWAKGLPDNFRNCRPLYNSEEIKNTKLPVLIVEGEKACHAAEHNLKDKFIVTTWHGGSQALKNTDFSVLEGKQVIVWPDADEPGKKAAEEISDKIKGSIILEIENKPSGWDAADAVLEGIDLYSFIKNLLSSNLPTLHADETDIVSLCFDAWDAVKQRNKPIRLIKHGGFPARIVFKENFPKAELMNKYIMQLESGRSALWVSQTKDRVIPARPPVSVANLMLHVEEEKIPLPALSRIIQAPVFDKTGRLIDRQGFDMESGIFYHPGDLQIKKIPDNPTSGEMREAVEFLGNIFYDFPFVSEADKAHAWVPLFIIPCREMLGNLPIIGFESPEAGTGKGLLCECVSYPFTAGNMEKFSPAKNDEEDRKRFTAALEGAKPVIMFDNYNSLAGAQISMLTTTETWSDRWLGKSVIVTFPVRAMFLLTANNLTLTTETARRYIRCRIDAKTEKPWLRESFKIKNLKKWVKDNRAEIVYSILVIIQSWIKAGMPRFKDKRLGSYDEFSEIIGGILNHAGITGFLKNIIEVYESANVEAGALSIFVSEWYKEHGTAKVSAAELFQIAKDFDNLPISGKDETAQRKSFSYWMGKNKDKVYNIMEENRETTIQVLNVGIERKVNMWRLIDLQNPPKKGELF